MYIIIEYTALVTCHVLMFARECTWMRRHTHARTRTCAYNHAFSDVLKRAALRTQRKAATLPLSFKQLFVAVFWVFVKWNASKRGVARRRRLGRRNLWRDRSGESLDRYIFTINSRFYVWYDLGRIDFFQLRDLRNNVQSIIFANSIKILHKWI